MSVFSFKDAAKIKSWDAWSDHERTAEPASVLAREKPCVTWTALNVLDPGLAPLGRLATRTSAEIRDSGWDVNCACLDRDYADWDAFKELLPMLGAKHARFISGWAKTEQEKGVYDFSWLDPHIRECAATGVRPWIALAYGNPVWGSDFRLGMRVRQITGDPASFDAMMGEAGCPAQLEFSHALPNHPWTELSQAKWNLRRALLDAAAGMRSSLFSMIDCQYTFMLQSFGLVRSNALKEFVYRRPAWFAMRNVYGLLDREARPLGPARRDGAILRADFERGGARLAFLWFADGTPSDDRFFEAARLAHGFRDPVWVEMVTGRAFALAEGEDILDLAALLPGVAVPGRNGGRAADVAFRVVADAAGSYRFRITNDYFGEIVANGVPLGAFENPNSWCEWTDVRVPLREGANEIVVRTRAGGGGVWHLGVRLPPAGVVAA